MITFIVHLKAAPENGPGLEAMLTHVRDMTLLHEPGVAYYSFAKSTDEPGTYAVIEVYRDAGAHAAHMQTDWVKGMIPTALRLTEGRIAIRQYVSPGTQPAIPQMKNTSHEMKDR